MPKRVKMGPGWGWGALILVQPVPNQEEESSR